MAKKYTNKNTKVTDDEVRFILSQHAIIDEQVRTLTQSKRHILKTFDITYANLRLRKNALKEK